MTDKIRNAGKAKVIGVIAIILALAIAIGYAITAINDDEQVSSNESGQESEQTLPEVDEEEPAAEGELYQEPIPQDAAEGNIGVDIKTETARQQMDLEISMLPEMEEEIPDMTSLKAAMEDYLIENDLWGSVTRAQSDFVIVKDYNKNTVQLEFELNDKAATHLIAKVDKNTGNITLNHY